VRLSTTYQQLSNHQPQTWKCEWGLYAIKTPYRFSFFFLSSSFFTHKNIVHKSIQGEFTTKYVLLVYAETHTATFPAKFIIGRKLIYRKVYFTPALTSCVPTKLDLYYILICEKASSFFPEVSTYGNIYFSKEMNNNKDCLPVV